MRIPKLYISVFFVFSYSFALGEDKGIKLYNNNQYDKAKKYYEKVLLERKVDASASFGLGATAFQQKDYSLAMKGFENALNTDNVKLKSSAYYNMANLLVENQKLEESLAFYRQSLILDPNDLDTKINYELVKFQLQDQQKDQSNDESQNNRTDSSNDKNDEQKNKEKKDSKNNNDFEEERENNASKEKNIQDQTPQDKQNAAAILDALKNNEKINKKLQISKFKGRKLEKDW